jgi:hypothetical protein
LLRGRTSTSLPIAGQELRFPRIFLDAGLAALFPRIGWHAIKKA